MLPECIRIHENHSVRLKNCEEDITNFAQAVRKEMTTHSKDVWKAIDVQRSTINKLLMKIFLMVTVPMILTLITILLTNAKATP